MTSPFELALQLRLTQRFIDADPTTVVLTPREPIADGAGGFRIREDPPRPEIVVRLIPASDAVPERSTSEGVFAMPSFRILAMPDAEMDRYDRFEWKGHTWEIVHISLKPEYEKKGDVVRVA